MSQAVKALVPRELERLSRQLQRRQRPIPPCRRRHPRRNRRLARSSRGLAMADIPFLRLNPRTQTHMAEEPK